MSKNPVSGNRDDLLSIESNEYYEDQSFSGIEWGEGHKLNNVQLFDCILKNCKFYKTSFVDCTFENCMFEASDLTLASIQATFFSGVKFVDTKLTGIEWADAASPLDVNFNRCTLDYSGFAKLDLRNTKMIECQVREVDFSKADLRNATCCRSDFSGAIFSDTNLERADFRNATNYSIHPDENRIHKAKFSFPEVLSLLNKYHIVIE